MKRDRLLAFLLLLAAVPSGASTPPPRMVLPFIEDDYARALSEARSKEVPIFVEAWAPW